MKGEDGFEDRNSLTVGIQNLLVRLPPDRSVHRHLDPRQAFVVGSHEPQDMGRQHIVRVYAPALLLKFQAPDLFPLDQSGDTLIFRWFQRPFQPDEGALDLEPVSQNIFVHGQKRREFFGQSVRIFHFPGIRIQGFRHVADGQFLAGPVIDRPTGGLQAAALLELLPRPFRPGPAVNQLDPGQANGQQHQ